MGLTAIAESVFRTLVHRNGVVPIDDFQKACDDAGVQHRDIGRNTSFRLSFENCRASIPEGEEAVYSRRDLRALALAVLEHNGLA